MSARYLYWDEPADQYPAANRSAAPSSVSGTRWAHAARSASLLAPDISSISIAAPAAGSGCTDPSRPNRPVPITTKHCLRTTAAFIGSAEEMHCEAANSSAAHRRRSATGWPLDARRRRTCFFPGLITNSNGRISRCPKTGCVGAPSAVFNDSTSAHKFPASPRPTEYIYWSSSVRISTAVPLSAAVTCQRS